MLSGLAVIGTDAPGQHAPVPALCLLAASLELPGVTAHVGALPAVEFLALDFAAAAAVEQTVSAGVDWRHAHAVYATASGEPESLGADGGPRGVYRYGHLGGGHRQALSVRSACPRVRRPTGCRLLGAETAFP